MRTRKMMSESRPQPVLFRFHVKPAQPPGNATIPSTSVRRHTLSQSDSPCISNAQHSVRPDQSRCIYHVLPRQQDVFHPTGHDLLNGRPLPGTENRHQVGPHVLRHMPYLPPRRERPSRLSQQLGITPSASRRRLQTSHETLPSDASPLVSRETDSRAWCGRHGRAPTSPPRPALPG